MRLDSCSYVCPNFKCSNLVETFTWFQLLETPIVVRKPLTTPSKAMQSTKQSVPAARLLTTDPLTLGELMGLCSNDTKKPSRRSKHPGVLQRYEGSLHRQLGDREIQNPHCLLFRHRTRTSQDMAAERESFCFAITAHLMSATFPCNCLSRQERLSSLQKNRVCLCSLQHQQDKTHGGNNAHRHCRLIPRRGGRRG